MPSNSHRPVKDAFFIVFISLAVVIMWMVMRYNRTQQVVEQNMPETVIVVSDSIDGDTIAKKKSSKKKKAPKKVAEEREFRNEIIPNQ